MKKYCLFVIPLMFIFVSCFIAEIKVPTKKQILCDNPISIPDNFYISEDIRGSSFLHKNKNIRFLMGSSNLDKNDLGIITEVYNFMITNKNIKIIIEGHADNRGSNSEIMNYPLSIERANAVYNILINLGIAPDRLSVFGFADSLPRYEYKKYRNRRVDFIIINCEEDLELYNQFYKNMFHIK